MSPLLGHRPFIWITHKENHMDYTNILKVWYFRLSKFIASLIAKSHVKRYQNYSEQHLVLKPDFTIQLNIQHIAQWKHSTNACTVMLSHCVSFITVLRSWRERVNTGMFRVYTTHHAGYKGMCDVLTELDISGFMYVCREGEMVHLENIVCFILLLLYYTQFKHL
jgi:hypothetical protein